jgi:tetraacyldisaccharide 4'-kinase
MIILYKSFIINDYKPDADHLHEEKRERKNFMSLESFFHEVISPKRPLHLMPVYGVLRLVAVFYRLGQWVRAGLYRLGVFKTRRLDCRVISIGNLTLGGTGKTPTVMMVADTLRRKGFKPAILSRGYGGQSGEFVNVVNDGQQTLLSPEMVGDEPVMMAQRLKDIPVLTGRIRYETGKYAIEQFGVDVLILDDGYQHLPLHRDLNILLCDATRPFGNGVVFPAGELREPLSAMDRADVICLTRCREDSQTGPIDESNSRQVPVIKTGLRVQSVIELSSGKETGMEAVQNQPVAAFCGIAHPLDFFHTLEQVPVQIVNQDYFSDHHDYSTDDLKTIESRAKQAGAKLIVTTEKDAVKLRGYTFDLPVYAVRIALEILEGQEAWDRLLLPGPLAGEAKG